MSNPILIKNIYYMLSYAFQALKQQTYENIASEDFENIHDLFAAILARGISLQLKHGLYHEYTQKTDALMTIRGKIEMPATMQNRMAKDRHLICEFDELSANNLFNQILKKTALILLRGRFGTNKKTGIKPERKAALKRVLLYFSEIDEIDVTQIRWETIRFHKNNQHYRMLINICNFILNGLLLSEEAGEYKLATFLDEQHMSRLYEKFVLEYYRKHHPDLHASVPQITWNLDEGCTGDFLPVMQTDITLSKGERKFVIDTKYYSRSMQDYYGVKKYHSGNLYQIYTYVKNADTAHSGNVAGMLLYAKTDEDVTPDSMYAMDGNIIYVKTLDLNKPFDDIAKKLDSLAELWFSDNTKAKIESAASTIPM